MSEGFETGDDVYCAFKDEKDLYRDGWFILKEFGASGVIISTRSGSVLFVPHSRILKIKKKGGSS